jgi:hypothetical protein
MILNSFIVLIGVILINSRSFNCIPLRLKTYLLDACGDCRMIEEKQNPYKLDSKSATNISAPTLKLTTQTKLVEQDSNEANLEATTGAAEMLLFNESQQIKQNKNLETILIAQLIRKSLLSAFVILYSIIYFTAIVILPLFAFILN